MIERLQSMALKVLEIICSIVDAIGEEVGK